MRTYQDAKIMAKSLRGCLHAKNVSLSHSECLEIVAQQLGYADWNILAAKLNTRLAPERVSCSFCGKAQYEVRNLIEGGCERARLAPRSCTFICDECVEFCAQVNAERVGDARESPRSEAHTDQHQS